MFEEIFDDLVGSCRFLGDDDGIIYPCDDDRIVANEETVIVCAALESKSVLACECLLEQIIEQFCGKMVAVQGSIKLEDLALVLQLFFEPLWKFHEHRMVQWSLHKGIAEVNLSGGEIILDNESQQNV